MEEKQTNLSLADDALSAQSLLELADGRRP